MACKADIRCTGCGQKKHKKGMPKCKRVWWWAKCTEHRWADSAVVSNRNVAMQRFKLHKHDAEETYPVEVQEALHNLRNEGLIASGYTGE